MTNQFTSMVDTGQIVQLTTAGYSAQMIARKLNISPRTVQRHRKQAGLADPRDLRPYTPAELEQIERLLEDGCSYSEVARTVGRKTKTIAERFKGMSSWTPRDGGNLRCWQRRMIRIHGESFEQLLREVAA